MAGSSSTAHLGDGSGVHLRLQQTVTGRTNDHPFTSAALGRLGSVRFMV